jgi:hypothetical protein
MKDHDHDDEGGDNGDDELAAPATLGRRFLIVDGVARPGV